MRSLIVAAGCFLPACELAIPLERNPSEVTLAHEVREVRNGADGNPVTAVIADPRFFDVVLPDGSVPSLVMRNDGTVTFDREKETDVYRLAVRQPDDNVVEYQLATPSLTIVDSVIGRSDRVPPAPLDVVQTVPNAPANTVSYLVTTGLWTETPHSAGGPTATNVSFRFRWADARKKSGLPGVLVAASGDRAYATTSSFKLAKRGAAFFGLTHACEHTFSALGVLANVNLQCSVMPVPVAGCLHLKTDFTGELARSAAVLPPIEHPSKSTGWFLGAAPAVTLAPQITLDLASRFAFTPSTTPATESDDEFVYTNPFPGHTAVVMLTAFHERPFTHPLATSHMNLSIGSRYWSAPAPACDTAEPAPALVAIPHAITLGGTPLDEEGQLVELAPGELVVRWTDTDGTADFYRVVLHEVIELFEFTTRATRRTYVVTDRAVVVDPSLLQPNKIYVIEIEAHAGAPGARDGDFGTYSLPYATGTGWSSTFQVP